LWIKRQKSRGIKHCTVVKERKPYVFEWQGKSAHQKREEAQSRKKF